MRTPRVIDFLIRERTVLQQFTYAVIFFLLGLLLISFRGASLGLNELFIMTLGTIIIISLLCGFWFSFFSSFFLAVSLGIFSSSSRSQVFLILASFVFIAFLNTSLIKVMKLSIMKLRESTKDIKDELKARENFFIFVSNDLRPTIYSIFMNLELIQRESYVARPISSVTKNLKDIRRLSEKIYQIGENLKDVIKIERGEFVINKEVIEISLLLGEAFEHAFEYATSKGVELILETHEAMHSLNCDEKKILQVLNILLDNAIRYSPKHSFVKLDVQTSENWVSLVVEDQGPGIAEEEIPKLFDRDWKMIDPSQMGAGLNLFVAKNIIEAHGGHLEVQSSFSSGTSFSIHLPRPRLTFWPSFEPRLLSQAQHPFYSKDQEGRRWRESE